MAKGFKTGGRQTGTQNRFTALKDAFLDAFESKELGGMDGLKKWGKKEENRKDFYMLIARMLPKNVTVDVEGTIKHEHTIKQEMEFPIIQDKRKVIDVDYDKEKLQ